MVIPVWFLVAIGLSVLMAMAAWRSPWRAAALWFGVAIAGQGASLQLIEAGPNLRYQHYPPLSTIIAEHPALLAIMVVQGVLVLAALGLRVRAALATRGIRVPVTRVVVGIGLSAISAATVSPDVMRYVAELAFAGSIQVIAIGTIILMVLDIPDAALSRARAVLRRALGSDDPVADLEPSPRVVDRFVLTLAATTVVISATLNVWSYERHPHIPDEVAYLHQARYFASGMLTMSPPPVPEAFDIDLFHYDSDRWFSPLSPGWPAVLALGVLAGAPWLVNPLLAGLCVLLTYTLFRRLEGERTARWVTFLLAFSPWLLFLSMSYMTHVSTLACALTAALAVQFARERRSAWWALTAGVAVGVASLIRPLDGVIVGALMALWALGAGGSRLRFGPLAALAAGTILTGALTFPYSWLLTGDPLRFPVNAYFDTYYHEGANDYGFGSNRGMGWPIDPNEGHSPVDALINSNLNIFGLNTDLFGWSAGSLLFVTLLIALGGVRRIDGRMLAVLLTVYVAHFFYYFSGGPDFGARYWFLMIVPLVALTAFGIRLLERQLGPRVGVAVVALSGMALLTFVPWRATDKYHDFRGMRADLRQIATEHDMDGDLVLIRGNRFPDYASAAVLNPLDLRSGATVFAWDRDRDVRAALLAAYPDRRVWIVDGPSVTHAGYRIVEGPVATDRITAEPAHER